MSDFEHLRYEQDGPVTVITIDRPERMNAIGPQTHEELVAAWTRFRDDDSARVAVLTGAGDKAFCAGGDLKPNADGTPFTIEAADPRHDVAGLLRRLDACRLPLVARVNGHALAGGFGLICACDLVVARDDVLLGVTEVKVGLFPMMILPYLMRVLPYRRLMEFCLTGETIKAGDPEAGAIVNYAVPAIELDAKTDWLVGRLVDKSPTGIRLGKQSLAKIREMSTDAALEYAQFMLANMARTEDAREGFAAFAEKRPPAWTGR